MSARIMRAMNSTYNAEACCSAAAITQPTACSTQVQPEQLAVLPPLSFLSPQFPTLCAFLLDAITSSGAQVQACDACFTHQLRCHAVFHNVM